MRIRTKLVAYFLIVALLVPILGGAALSRLRTIDQSVQNLTDNAVPRINDVQSLASIQRDQQAALLTYVAAGQPDDRQRYLELAPAFDERLAALSARDTSDTGSQIAQEITAARTKFTQAGAQLATARNTSDRNLDNLRTKNDQIVQELSSIRRRFVPTGQSGTDASGVPTALRYQINDLLLGTEGMLHMVALEKSIANEYKVAPKDTLRPQFENAGVTFNGWLQIAYAAGGSEDRAILNRVQSEFGEFESSARAMMAATDLSTKSLATFTDASKAVQASLDRYVGWQASAMESVRRQSAGTVNDAQSMIITVTIAGFLIAGLLGLIFARAITQPIRHLRDVAERVSVGDVQNIEINVTSKDEIADLADAFRRMVASLRFLMMKDEDGGQADELDFGKAAS